MDWVNSALINLGFGLIRHDEHYLCLAFTPAVSDISAIGNSDLGKLVNHDDRGLVIDHKGAITPGCIRVTEKKRYLVLMFKNAIIVTVPIPRGTIIKQTLFSLLISTLIHGSLKRVDIYVYIFIFFCNNYML